MMEEIQQRLIVKSANQVDGSRRMRARAATDAVKEKERLQGELDKMKARLKAAEQGSGGRKPQNIHRLSNGERRVKKVRFCGPVTGCEKYMMPSCARIAGALD
jgi:hypothetical protein